MKHASHVVIREIVLRDVPMTVTFWYYPAYEVTRDEPGFEGEIDIEAVFIDEFEVTNLFGEKALADVENELWKLLEEGESL